MTEQKWYGINFSNQQIIKGQQTVFLRFKNLTGTAGTSKSLYVMVIPEIINIDANDTNFKDIAYLNGADIFEINKITKDVNNLDPKYGNAEPTSKTTPHNSDRNPIFAINGFLKKNTSFDYAKYRFPVYLKIEINGQSGPIWSNLPEDGKINYRIDYNGNENLVVKLNFLITTVSPSELDYWDKYPTLFNQDYDPNDIKPGDVVFDTSSNKWYYIDLSNVPQQFEDPFFEEEGPWLGIKNLHVHGFYTKDSEWTGPLIDYQETYLFCYKSEETKTSRDKDYWLDKPVIPNGISDTEDSYMLLRTNPKLTGNIKMMVDSNSNLYLESIDANDELSNAKYKKIAVSPKSNYAADIQKSFSTLSSEIMYEIAERDKTYSSTKKTFAEQYDFYYGYGVSQLKSKYYSENFSLFAPIWLRKKLPDFFVIFKTRGPLNIESYKTGDRVAMINEIMQNSKILKTYDIREGSNIGTYLRGITESPLFNETPLSTNFEKDQLTEWYGVSYKDGIMSSKGQFLYDFYNTDAPINEFEDYITRGFERNGLLSTNLINIEFLFDDPEATDYEINRYFGLYVKEIELAKFELYADGFYKIPNQTPHPRKDIDAEPYSLQPFIQKNNNGIIIPIDNENGIIEGKLPPETSVSDTNRVFYVRDRNDNIDRIKGVKDYEGGSITGGDHYKFVGIELYDTTVDLSKYAGITKLTTQIDSKLLDDGWSQLVIEINDTVPNNPIIVDGEIFEIEWTDINQDKLKWEMIANPTGLQAGDFWDFPLYNYDETLYTNNFSTHGTPNQIAKALAGCINSFNNKIFKAIAIDNKIFIRSSVKSIISNGIIFRRKILPVSPIDSVTFFGVPTDFSTSINSTLNTSTTGNVTINEINNQGRFNEYSVEISETNGDIISTRITKNGGLVSSFTFDKTKGKTFTNQYVEIVFSVGDYFADDKWFLVPSIIKQNFIGGTSRKRNRALVKTQDILNINPDNWFQSQKSKYSRLGKWNVQGQPVHKLYNLEEPVYDEGILIGYNNLFSHSIIQIEENNFEFYINKERKIIGYDNFKPTVGILSFLDVKDFDFDWIRSDYSYVPNAELLHYFDNYELENGDNQEIELFQTYEVLSGGVKLEGYDTQKEKWVELKDGGNNSYSFSSTNKMSFNTFLPAYVYNNYDIDIDDTIIDNETELINYYFRNYKILKSLQNINAIRVVATSDNTIIARGNYQQDLGLNNFVGFLGLSDFISQEDEARLQALIDSKSINRFFFEQLSSEYDRLRENFIKEYAVKSRVVPYINKWVQSGSDCRDNKYRLNTSLAFGLNNFSPDTQISEQNPRLHTHEFFYLDKFPPGYSDDFYKNSRSYFFESLTDNFDYKGSSTNWYNLFKNNEQDWFTKYFTLGYPTEYGKEKVNKKLEERYIYTTYKNGLGLSEGIFRGSKFNISEIDPITENIIPDSKKYDKYKFSAILRLLPLSINSNEPSNTIEFIANDIYKTIVMITTVYLNDYRVNGGEYGYAFLYSAKSTLRNNDVIDKSIKYSLKYDEHDTDGIKFIGYTDLSQSLHYNGLSGSTILDYADTKLNGVFVFSNISLYNPYTRLNAKDNLSRDNFNPIEEILPIYNDNYNIEDQYNPNGYYGSFYITSMENGEFSEISQQYPNTLNKTIINIQSLQGNIISASQTFIEVFNKYTYQTSGVTTKAITWPTKQVVSVPDTSINETTNAWYLSGGTDYLKNRLSEISFATIFNNVNKNKSIEYYTVDKIGIHKGYYKFNFVDLDRIDKKTRVQVLIDDDKPEVYREKSLVGFEVESLSETETIFRHRGNYEPKTRKILNYWVREDKDMTEQYGIDFVLANTRLGVEYNLFGEIENLFYSKVSPDPLLKISTTSKYKSLYPLINEVSIDKKPYWIFNSNWDNNYYNLYTGLDINTPTEGTNELTEQKAFFGSKVMNTPKVFELHTFKDNEVTYEVKQGLQSTDVSSLATKVTNNPMILQDSNKSKLIISINAADRLIREMIENDAKRDFKLLKDLGITRFSDLSDDNLVSEVEKYLRINILPLYKVTEINLYKKDPADEKLDLLFRIDLSEYQKIQGNYKLSKNTNVTQRGEFEFIVQETLDTKNYNAYSISITLERI